MSRLLAYSCVVLLLTSVAAAQTSNPSSVPPGSAPTGDPGAAPTSSIPPTAPSRLKLDTTRPKPPDRGSVTVNGRREPVFIASSPKCVRAGEILLLSGHHFSALNIVRADLNHESHEIQLQLLNKGSSQLAFKIPSVRLEPGKLLDLFITDERRGLMNTGLSVAPCPETKVVNAPAVQELVVLGPVELEDPVRAAFEQNNTQILQSFSLQGFEQFMFIIQTADADNVIADMQLRFPDVSIDENADLSASAGKPRLFASDMIGWNDNLKCVAPHHPLKIGLLDGAVDLGHPAFGKKQIVAHDFLEGAEKNLTHATAIASSLIGDAPDLGIKGLVGGATIFNAIVLRETSDGQAKASVKSVVLGLDWLITHKVRLVGVSLATTRKNSVLQKVFAIANVKGMLIFAAAGNFGPDAPPAYPANLPDIFAITAIDAANRIYPGANTGDYIDFAAPGVDVWLATPKGGAAYQTGTSFAVPYALAVAAVYVQKNAQLSRSLLDKILKNGAQKISHNPSPASVGAGIIHLKC